jgi:hypothetical protein
MPFQQGRTERLLSLQHSQRRMERTENTNKKPIEEMGIIFRSLDFKELLDMFLQEIEDESCV